MTPWGAGLGPGLIAFSTPTLGSSQPSSPESCAVYQTPPSLAGATSCGPCPRVTGYSCNTNGVSVGGCGLGSGVPGVAGALARTLGVALAGAVATGVHAVAAMTRARSPRFT